jgi:hypothetical protein
MKWTIIILILVTVFLVGCNKSSECKDYTYNECPKECVVCPPCEVCSSISCQTEEFCNNMGFNRSWSEAIKARLNSQN